MSDVPNIKTDSPFDQTLASILDLTKNIRNAASARKEEAQTLIYEQAASYIDTVRDFIDKPGNILGSPATKHGEIAEVAEVGVRNAWDILNGIPLSASLHNDRTGPVDYIVDGADVQSKFYNGVRNTLSGVTEHLENYPDFPKGNSYYAIPKDQYKLLQKALNGEQNTGLSENSINTLKQRIQDIETLTGRDYKDVVRPASFDYKEVQTGAIDEALDKRQNELIEENKKRIEDIRSEHEPSWQEGLKSTVAGAAIGASVSFVRASFVKYREGKNIFKGEFTFEDWKDVGLDTAKGAAIGGVSAGALYLMTNCTNIAAPLAGAMVSAVKGLTPLVHGYNSGAISLEQFVDTGCMVCAEVAMVAAATAIGQALIPIPVLGALVGSIAGQTLSSILSNELQKSSAAISARINEYSSSLNLRQKQNLENLLARFSQLGDLITAAFDVRLNANIITNSATLAITYGVERSKILRSTHEVDKFMLG